MATSPPAHAPALSLPKKRPSITLPPNPHPAKRRKGSIASASTHPLRQTSFPPPDSQNNALYSPVSADDDLDVDDEIASNVGSTTDNGRGGGRGKRGGGGTGTSKARGGGRLGRPPKASRGDTASVADGETSTPTSVRRGGTSATGGVQGGGGEENSSDESDDGGGGEDTALEGGKLTRARQEEEKSRRAMFLANLPGEHFARYEQWNRIHLKKEVVRRLTNQTLSQSVPASVITTINAYTKVFAGEIVDRARGVQREWVAAGEKLPTGDRNEIGEGEGAARVKERDLGPLLPDHLREALRRYRSDRDGGTVGFTGMSLEGREAASVRSGGRRLFR